MDDPENKTPEQLAAEADAKAANERKEEGERLAALNEQQAAKAPAEEKPAEEKAPEGENPAEDEVRREVNRNTPRIDEDGNKHWE